MWASGGLCCPFSGDRFAQAFELCHPLPQLAELLPGLFALGVDPVPELFALGVNPLAELFALGADAVLLDVDALVDVFAEQPHFASQTPESRTDRDEDRHPSRSPNVGSDPPAAPAGRFPANPRG